MQKIIFLALLLIISVPIVAQVGINTTHPEGTLDIVTSNDTGVVVPRVSSIENVTDGNGNPAPNGTIVYDSFREDICYRVNNKWVCIGVDPDTNTPTTEVTYPVIPDNMIYVKASNTDASDQFGASVSLSDDGNYLAIGALYEDSNATGINGDETNNTASTSGAVYVFYFDGTNWLQQAYIKASNTEANDFFGVSVALAGDGSRLVVGAHQEDSNATVVNGDETNNLSFNSGAAYVFSRSGSSWTQEAYLKASNTGASDFFGIEAAISGDGSRIAIGASRESSNATGVNGDETNNSASNSGAVYLFSRTGTAWSQEAYIKASNTQAQDSFGGGFISLDATGSRLAISAYLEDSNAVGINGNEADNSASGAGAVYVFLRTGTTWAQEAYIKASNTDALDGFGFSGDLSSDGTRLVVGSHQEASNATGVNGNESDNSSTGSGAAFVFLRTGTTWTQEAYVKASNTEVADRFGVSVAISGDGSRIVVGANGEDSDARGLDGDQTNNDQNESGAIYSFLRTGTIWAQEHYIKASNGDSSDAFGFLAGIDTNTDGSVIIGASYAEDGNATGINGNQTNNSMNASGAAYIIEPN